mmetsp:Transcript_5177/g.20850  ORF Transcript_5177/g.20850 Transcript_5177/m.20850 type:complete len:272 (-) Transcript_5177:602-1417(-)
MDTRCVSVYVSVIGTRQFEPGRKYPRRVAVTELGSGVHVHQFLSLTRQRDRVAVNHHVPRKFRIAFLAQSRNERPVGLHVVHVVACVHVRGRVKVVGVPADDDHTAVDRDGRPKEERSKVRSRRLLGKKNSDLGPVGRSSREHESGTHPNIVRLRLFRADDDRVVRFIDGHRQTEIGTIGSRRFAGTPVWHQPLLQLPICGGRRREVSGVHVHGACGVSILVTDDDDIAGAVYVHGGSKSEIRCCNIKLKYRRFAPPGGVALKDVHFSVRV